MNLDQLRVFAAVAETLQITAAARRLNRSASATSEMLRELETRLGVELVDRARRRWRLTAAGERLLPYAGSIVALADEAQAAVASDTGVAGDLSIGALETLAARVLPLHLGRLAVEYPLVTPKLVVADTGSLLASVSAGELDATVLIGRRILPEQLRCRTIAEERLVVALPRSHPAVSAEATHQVDLTGLRFLVTAPGCTFRAIFDGLWDATDPRPLIAGEVGSIAAAQAMIASGGGAAILPACAVDHPGVRAIALPADVPPVPINVIWKRRPRQRSVLTAFLGCCDMDQISR